MLSMLMRFSMAVALLLAIIGATPVQAATPEIWYGPGQETPDLTEMFTNPQTWAQARSHIRVIKFGPKLIQRKNYLNINSGTDLHRVNAFHLLQTWGIGLTLAAPAIKNWDCTGKKALESTLHYVELVHQYGGELQSLSLDEPLASGVGVCKNTMAETARKTAQYFHGMHAAAPNVAVGDVEPYPSHPVPELIAWTRALLADGARPAFLQLDVNTRALQFRPDVNVTADLRAMQRFLREEHIPFGVIIWSGHNPESSDRNYYDHAMQWARTIHAAIGAPDQLIIESWSTRASKLCAEGQCTRDKPQCTQQDPRYCGLKSVPVNLPESGPGVFSGTRLVNDIARLFGSG